MSNCPCRLISVNKETVKCQICFNHQHKECVKDALGMINYECPNCQIKSSDHFFKNLTNILTPTLIPATTYGNTLKSTFAIGSEINKMFNLAEIIPNSNSKFIILRCLRLDKNGFEHHWPMNSTISVNNKLLKTNLHPKDLNRSTQRKDFPLVFYFREEDAEENYHGFNRSHMFKFTDCLHFHKLNHLEVRNEVNKNPKDIYSYVVSIDLVEVYRHVEDVINKIPVVNDVNVLKKRQHFLSKFKNELEILNEQVSFLDSYTGNGRRIKLPVRSVNCHHLKVFDLRQFLLLRRNKSYNCPFCKAKAIRIYIDGFIKDQIEKEGNCDSIIIGADYKVIKVSSSDINNAECNLKDQNIEKYNKKNNIANSNYINIDSIVDLTLENDLHEENECTLNFLNDPPKIKSEGNGNKLNNANFISNVSKSCNGNNGIIIPRVNKISIPVVNLIDDDEEDQNDLNMVESISSNNSSSVIHINRVTSNHQINNKKTMAGLNYPVFAVQRAESETTTSAFTSSINSSIITTSNVTTSKNSNNQYKTSLIENLFKRKSENMPYSKIINNTANINNVFQKFCDSLQCLDFSETIEFLKRKTLRK